MMLLLDLCADELAWFACCRQEVYCVVVSLLIFCLLLLPEVLTVEDVKDTLTASIPLGTLLRRRTSSHVLYCFLLHLRKGICSRTASDLPRLMVASHLQTHLDVFGLCRPRTLDMGRFTFAVIGVNWFKSFKCNTVVHVMTLLTFDYWLHLALNTFVCITCAPCLDPVKTCGVM